MYTFSRLLSAYFSGVYYKEAVKRFNVVLENPNWKSVWQEYRTKIEKRALPEGEAVKLIYQYVGIFLYEKTDEEAYRWFDILFKNVDAGEVIVEYHFYHLLENIFKNHSYEQAVLQIIDALENEDRQSLWIEHRKLLESRAYGGIFLHDLIKRTGTTLYEETDEEAYRWFDILFKNVDAGSVVETY